MIDFFHLWKTLFKCTNTTSLKCRERKSILNRSWNFIALRESPCTDLCSWDLRGWVGKLNRVWNLILVNNWEVTKREFSTITLGISQ